MPINEVFVQNTGTPFEQGGVSDFTSITDLTVQIVNLGKDTAGANYGQTINVSADINTNSLTVEDYDVIQLVFRDSNVDAEVFKSAPLDVSTLEVANVSYAAPTQQETDVVIPAGPTGGGTYGIKVVNEESGAQPFEYRFYEVEVDDGESATDIVSKFVSDINDREDSINGYEGSSVTASEPTGGTLRLTADEVGDIFALAYQGFEPTSETTNTNPTIGQGTYEQVKDYEERTRGTVGRYVTQNNVLGSLPEPKIYADASGNYDLLNITAENDYDKGMNKSIARLVYMVALESAVTHTDADASGTDDYLEWLDPKIVASG